ARRPSAEAAAPSPSRRLSHLERSARSRPADGRFFFARFAAFALYCRLQVPTMNTASKPARPRTRLTIPVDQDNVVLTVDGKDVRLTNLRKVYWTGLGLTKGDLLQYYADVAHVLLPHVRDRAMVMKRYPHGAAGEFFFMKRAPTPRPAWIEICRIDHGHD